MYENEKRKQLAAVWVKCFCDLFYFLIIWKLWLMHVVWARARFQLLWDGIYIYDDDNDDDDDGDNGNDKGEGESESRYDNTIVGMEGCEYFRNQRPCMIVLGPRISLSFTYWIWLLSILRSKSTHFYHPFTSWITVIDGKVFEYFLRS